MNSEVSTEAMITSAAQVLVTFSIAFIVAGCAAQVTPAPNVGGLVKCQVAPCTECPPKPPRQGAGDVWVVLHLMQARGMDHQARELQYREQWNWQLAKTADAVSDFWMPEGMPKRVYDYFGLGGKVTTIWEKHQIHLRLLRIETCTYLSDDLRLDGRPRDSMFTPESQVPWAHQLFRGINRLFTVSEPNVIHVLLWWSIQEDDVEQVTVRGYARSAAHGGPAVWADAYGCEILETLPNDRCALLLAHEIGHTLGLQHVDDALNLMHPEYSGACLAREQAERARREATRQFIRKR